MRKGDIMESSLTTGSVDAGLGSTCLQGPHCAFAPPHQVLVLMHLTQGVGSARDTEDDDWL